jgi:hypothetical protein
MRLFFLALICIFTLRANAQDLALCVGNVSQFANAIDQAASNTVGFTRVIARLRVGTYDLSNTAGFMGGDNLARVIRKDLVISGGYNSDCSARTQNAFNTVVLNTNIVRGLFLAPLGDLLMQGLNFSNFEGNLGTAVISNVDTLVRIEFSNNRVFGGSGSFKLNAESGVGTSLLIFKNNELGGRSGQQCSLTLSGDAQADTTVRLLMSNNTVSGNLSDSGQGAVCLSNIEQPSFYNNIFFGNGGGSDLYAIGGVSPITTRNNIIEDFGNVPSGSASGNSTSNPLFLNILTGDYRVQNSSPAINSGEDAIPLGVGSADVLGNPRTIGVSVDRGAHESSITGIIDLVVSNTLDAGAGSLRDAMSSANASPGFNRIVFNIAGACPRIINLSSALPLITDSLTIDGTTQPGFVANTNDISYNGTRCVLLKPAGDPIGTGLQVSAAATATTRLVVNSLIFGGFTYAVRLNAGRAHQLIGNQFGGNINAPPNSGGIWVRDADDVQIGGSEPSAVNSFADSLNVGTVLNAGIILSATSERAEIVRNFIGFGANGAAAGGNDYGIHVSSNSHIIEHNVIGNNSVGILFTSTAAGSSLTSNLIGLPAYCFFPPCTNSGNSVGVIFLGHDNAMVSNVTAYNSGPGIRVEGDSNSILNHLAYGNGNGNPSVPPIDIAGAGFTQNDNDATSTPPIGNRGQNFPVIFSVNFSAPGAFATVQGSLNSRNGRYRISVYGGDRVLDQVRCESSVSLWTGEIDIVNGTASTNGGAAFSAQVSKSAAAGKLLSATATRNEVFANGTDLTDTSEIGPCIEAPFLVDGFE